MISNCLKCRKNTESKNRKVVEAKNRTQCFYQILQCDSKKSRIIKEQQTSGSLSSLGIIAPLRQIPLVDPILF